MEPTAPKSPSVAAADDAASPHIPATRRPSSSHASDDSHTALDFIRNQTQLEADAREALPYRIELCTNPLGPLRQAVYACLTCNPAPSTEEEEDNYSNAAGICYACSVQCHGEHTLVELFTKRNFVCDCGTTRFPDTAPCALRIHPATNTKGGVCGETPAAANQYNHNFRNRFCGCGLDYDPFQQKGTMFQCLGLGTRATGGCGEDWWHPGCVVGLGPTWYEGGGKGVEKKGDGKTATTAGDALPTISEDANGAAEEAADDDDEPPMPEGFPAEDAFDGFICYKCVDAFPWIKQYAGAPCFLPPVFYKPQGEGSVVTADTTTTTVTAEPATAGVSASSAVSVTSATSATSAGKRKAEDDKESTTTTTTANKKARCEDGREPSTESVDTTAGPPPCKRTALPPPPPGRFSLFFTESFRDQLCRCAACFPLLKPHPQLLEEEDTYEPPVSDSNAGSDAGGNSTEHGGSLYERGESALQNVDRVRALEGVMAYNHLKDKLKPFFQTFADSGQAISAEDIKAYFAKLRGDEQGIQEASEAAEAAHRREQEGY